MKIRKAKNQDSLTEFDQMHLPWILLPEFIKRNKKFDMTVKVGKVDHPMTSEHYISCISFYINGKFYKRKELTLSGPSETKFEISLDRDSILAARAECNLHGVWESERKVVLYRGNNNKIENIKWGGRG